MNRDGHEAVKFFYGTEVEHTPAYGKQTLFVVGVQPVEDIEKAYKDCEHIFFGANHSYDPPKDSIEEYGEWEYMIKYFLKQGILCTLDVPYSQLEEIHDDGYDEYNNFIAQLRISIPYVSSYNYNTMVKIDDKDFDATNPGVWTHNLHKLMDRTVFTPWSDYSKDEVV
jgi:hypothetical protein